METKSKSGVTDRCHRCGGLMVNETIKGQLESPDFEAWRCVVCGEIVDLLIIANRRARDREALGLKLRTLKPARSRS
jgi:hypothetical protein